MKVIITKGATDQTVYVFVPDSSSTTGAGLTGLAYNTASLTCYYVRPLAATAQLNLATQTVTGAHSDGGFVEVSAANMPGWYRLDLSDAIVASGVNSVGVQLKGATNMAPVNLEIQLVAANLQDSVRLGLTALPNAAADAAGGLPISDAGGLDLDAQRSDVAAILADTADMQPKFGTFENLGSGATIAGNLEDMAYDGSATYDRTTDSQQAIRDAGASLTDFGVIASTTIATLASQTSFTLTAGSADDNAYNDCRAIVTDASTAVQKAIGTILDYTGSTKTITLSADPGIFTMAAGDLITILPPAGAGGGGGGDATEAKQDTIIALIGTPANTSLSGDLADIEGKVDDLEGRLTSARAGYLDNLSGGAVALESTVAKDATVAKAATVATAASIAALNNISAAEVKTQARTALQEFGAIENP